MYLLTLSHIKLCLLRVYLLLVQCTSSVLSVCVGARRRGWQWLASQGRGESRPWEWRRRRRNNRPTTLGASRPWEWRHRRRNNRPTTRGASRPWEWRHRRRNNRPTTLGASHPWEWRRRRRNNRPRTLGALRPWEWRHRRRNNRPTTRERHARGSGDTEDATTDPRRRSDMPVGVEAQETQQQTHDTGWGWSGALSTGNNYLWIQRKGEHYLRTPSTWKPLFENTQHMETIFCKHPARVTIIGEHPSYQNHYFRTPRTGEPLFEKTQHGGTIIFEQRARENHNLRIPTTGEPCTIKGMGASIKKIIIHFREKCSKQNMNITFWENIFVFRRFSVDPKRNEL